MIGTELYIEKLENSKKLIKKWKNLTKNKKIMYKVNGKTMIWKGDGDVAKAFDRLPKVGKHWKPVETKVTARLVNGHDRLPKGGKTLKNQSRRKSRCGL